MIVWIRTKRGLFATIALTVWMVIFVYLAYLGMVATASGNLY